MPRGTVKWFNGQKGYGFIEDDGPGDDVFVHITDVQAAGLETLREGQRLAFGIAPGQKGKSKAVKIEDLRE